MTGQLGLVHTHNSHFDIQVDDLVIARYVYRPDAPQVESPKPYFVPLRTLAGDDVTIFRPHDHVWHKGLYLGFPYVGEENLYGGPTYVHGQGYVFLHNNGSMVHEGFDCLELHSSSVVFSERLSWLTHDGHVLARELREVRIELPDGSDEAWFLRFCTTITNPEGGTLVLSSPTVRGRPLAGYAGLMWRGPRSFTGGTILGAGGLSGPEMMGQHAEWLAFVGRHDGTNRESTIVFVDADRSSREATKWFVRTEPYAMVGVAPVFDADVDVPPGRSFRLDSTVAIANGAWAPSDIEKYVAVHGLMHVNHSTESKKGDRP